MSKCSISSSCPCNVSDMCGDLRELIEEDDCDTSEADTM